VSDVPAISTTSLSLDGGGRIGGVPRGRIVEIYVLRVRVTTLALHIVAEAQKAGGVAAYIDAEHAMDADYAANSESISTSACSPSRVVKSATGRYRLRVARIIGIHSMLSIDIGSNSTSLLSFCHNMKSKSGLPELSGP